MTKNCLLNKKKPNYSKKLKKTDTDVMTGRSLNHQIEETNQTQVSEVTFETPANVMLDNIEETPADGLLNEIEETAADGVLQEIEETPVPGDSESNEEECDEFSSVIQVTIPGTAIKLTIPVRCGLQIPGFVNAEFAEYISSSYAEGSLIALKKVFNTWCETILYGCHANSTKLDAEKNLVYICIKCKSCNSVIIRASMTKKGWDFDYRKLHCNF